MTTITQNLQWYLGLTSVCFVYLSLCWSARGWLDRNIKFGLMAMGFMGGFFLAQSLGFIVKS